MTTVYLVQHGEKEQRPGEPGLTQGGRQQATQAGQWLRGQGIGALYASPMRRAQQTAGCIATVTGLPVQTDARLRERLNWDGSQPYEAFLAQWARTTDDRDFVPAGGDSSRQAGARLMAFLAALPATPAALPAIPAALPAIPADLPATPADLPGTPGPVAAVTHGGVTIDLLRDLLGDDALPPHLLTTGIPPGAITTISDLRVVMIASTSHLS
jgi:broad specificity phosphatase PhoE